MNIFTAGKPSCGKVINVFTPVCDSVHRGCVYPSKQWVWFVQSPLGRPYLDRHPLGRHPIGQTTPWADTPLGRHPKRRSLKRAVSILMECILVSMLFSMLFVHRHLQYCQRRIQDFPAKGAPIRKGHQHIIWSKYCLKLHENEDRTMYYVDSLLIA